MKSLVIFAFAAVAASANPENVITNIEKSDYNRAMYGSADSTIFGEVFFGYPPGTIVTNFNAVCGPQFCTLTGTVDTPPQPTFQWTNPPGGDPPGGNPPGGDPPGGNPPGGNPLGGNPPTNTVPEIDPGAGASALSLLGGVMLILRGRKKQ